MKFNTHKKILLAIALLILATANYLHASDGKKARQADNLFLFSNYTKALPLYLELVEKYPSSVVYNFRTAVCYLYSNVETFKCISYFEIARKNITSSKDSIPELFYYMGNAYRMANRFTEAIQCYTTFKKLIEAKSKKTLLGKTIDIELEQCMDGNMLKESPTNARLMNLGSSVNSIYPDYAPVISEDESMLIFTSKRKECTGTKITPDGNYYEDIFISKNTSDDWISSQKLDSSFVKLKFFAALFASAKNIGKSINTNEHDASIGLSSDGKTLYMYRFNDIWQSQLENGKWNKPTRSNNVIDEKNSHESSMTLTIDGSTTYFASERDGGFGGKDLYMSVKQSDGTWSDPENLGPAINTELDEDAPYVDPGSKTLYFSSQAHGSIGGFDVFKSKFKDSDWTPPENLGYPINSGADDIFFILNSKQNRAYISSMRVDGIGNYDIYVINYIRPSKVIFATTFSNDLKPKDLQGIVIGSLKKDTIKVALNGKNDFIYNSEEQYKMIIPQYNDNVKVSFDFKTPESYGFFPFYQEVNYDMVVNWKGQLIGYKTTVYSAFFDLEKELNKNQNRDGKLKVEEEYSAFIKTIPPDNSKLQVYTHINYIDTTTVPLVVVNTVKKSNTKTTKVLSRNPNAFKTILFDFSKSDLSVEATTDIAAVVNYLNENKDVNMEIVGHTDSKGLNLFNSILSKKRANQIMQYLILEGISGTRLKAVGMGEVQPVALNENADGTDNPDGRKQNRRVEFVTISTK